MGEFIIPDGPISQPVPPPPPPDPRVAREEKIANDTRVESELNRFIASRQDVMFNNPDAFYRTQGRDAIDVAPVATKNLEQLRDNLLNGLANDYQRRRLGDALEAQMQLSREDMTRHVAAQSLAWQRQTAQDRIALLTKEAAYHHGDPDLVDVIGRAAANAARAHARVGGIPAGGSIEDATAATARSGVLSAAIQAKLDKGDAEGANTLFTHARDQLDPQHAQPLVPQLEIFPQSSVAQSGDPVTSNEVMTDATPDPMEDGQQYAQAGSGRPPSRTRGGQPTDPLTEIRAANFQSHLDAIRELEPNNRELSYIAPKDWVPTVGDLARVNGELLRVRQRFAKEQHPERSAIPLGEYAGESIPARSSDRNFTKAERGVMNRIGAETGCHTCGTKFPGTISGNYVPDHQPASSLNPPGGLQRYFPQCLSCSLQQGLEIMHNLKPQDIQ